MTAERTKPNILIRCEIGEPMLRRIEERAGKVYVEPWQPDGPEPALRAPLEELDIVVTRGLADEIRFAAEAPRLRWIHSVTVGVEKTLTPWVKANPIAVTNVRGLNAVPIAEYVMGALLAWNRGLYEFARQQREKVWRTVDVREVSGSTIGIIGYGSIGREIALRARAFGMSVLACSRRGGDASAEPVDRFVAPGDVDDLLSASDCVVDCLPQSPETFRFMNADRFGAMKRSALFINVGRGATVDEEALLRCLRSGAIAGAVLDVFDTEPLPREHGFWEEERIFVTPHNAFASPKHWSRVFDHFIDNLDRFLRGGPLRNSVDKEKGY